MRCLKAPKQAVTPASRAQRVRPPCTHSSIPLVLPLSKVHSSAQVSSLYKHMEKCLPSGFSASRSHQVAAGSVGATSWHVPGGMHSSMCRGGSPLPLAAPAAQPTAPPWDCTCMGLYDISPAQSIRGGSRGSQPGSPSGLAFRNTSGMGSQAWLPAEPMLIPLHSQTSSGVIPTTFSYNQADSQLTHLIPGFCFPKAPP